MTSIEPLPGAQMAAQAATTYYLNTQSGNDAHSGTSAGAAWRTLERLSSAALRPGDRVLLESGQTFHGSLKLDAVEGTQDRPICITSTGRAPAAVDAGAGDGIALAGASWIALSNIAIQGCGRKGGSNGSGIRAENASHLVIEDVGVSGFRIAGVAVSGGSHIRLLRAHARDNGFAGIWVARSREDGQRADHIYIGYCTADNNPGDPKNLTSHSGNGIIVGGAEDTLIEYCEASRNGWDMPRKGNGPVGIWGWDCDRLTIQHCISHDNQSPGDDGDGFDFDGGVTNSLMQYNLSYSNAGCGYLLCQFPGAGPWHNNTVRYCISFNDGVKNFQSGIGLWIGGQGISGAQVYNNTVVNPWHAVTTLGDVPDIAYRNNIFCAGESFLSGDFSHSRFENNLYSGPGPMLQDGQTVYHTLAEWSAATGQELRSGTLAAIQADPKLVLPVGPASLPEDPAKLDEMSYFRLLPGSQCIGAGTQIPDNGGRGFFGALHPPGLKPSIGAA